MLFPEAYVKHFLYSECTLSNRLKTFSSHLVFFFPVRWFQSFQNQLNQTTSLSASLVYSTTGTLNSFFPFHGPTTHMYLKGSICKIFFLVDHVAVIAQ